MAVNTALLPSGFTDLLPPDAQTEADAISILMAEFRRFSYKRVKPPLAEFEETLLAQGPGKDLSEETFRLLDPKSYRMMGIRSDITAQIARIAGSRLHAEPRPLRLMYANDVLRTRSSQHRTERQFCMVGCEMIGMAQEDVQSDIEVCVLAVSGLQALGIKNVTLDLALPRLTGRILERLDLESSGQKSRVRAAVENRDIHRLRTEIPEGAAIFEALVEASGPAEDSLKLLKSIPELEQESVHFKRLETIYRGLQNALEDLDLCKSVQITIDPLETRGFEYHTGVSFSIFSGEIQGELGRGGHYVIGENEPATGFTLYMDTVRTAMPVKNEKTDVLFVPCDISWGDIKALQRKGWIVSRGTKDGCTHEYKDGTPVKL